jgi:uracil-DNA glycosylase
LLPLLTGVRLTLAIGQYAQAHFLGERRGRSLTDTVRDWATHANAASPVFPLPHPSPRNVGWFKHNPWFDAEVIPALRQRVAKALGA